MCPLKVALWDVLCTNSHHAVVVFGLKVKAAYDVNSDQALLRATLRQLPKFPWWF